MSLTILLPWHHTGFQTSPILNFSGHQCCSILIFAQQCLMCMTQQAYKCVSLSLWPHLTFFKLKISNIEIKRQGTGKEWVAMGTEFFTAGVFLLHYQHNKFQWSVLQVGQDSSIYILDIILGLLVCHHSSICIFKLNYLHQGKPMKRPNTIAINYCMCGLIRYVPARDYPLYPASKISPKAI